MATNLGGMTLGTLINLRHSVDAELLFTSAGPDEKGLYAGWILHNIDKWAPIINTKHVFSTPEEAEAHMRAVVKETREMKINPSEVGGLR